MSVWVGYAHVSCVSGCFHVFRMFDYLLHLSLILLISLVCVFKLCVSLSSLPVLVGLGFVFLFVFIVPEFSVNKNFNCLHLDPAFRTPEPTEPVMMHEPDRKNEPVIARSQSPTVSLTRGLYHEAAFSFLLHT